MPRTRRSGVVGVYAFVRFELLRARTRRIVSSMRYARLPPASSATTSDLSTSAASRSSTSPARRSRAAPATRSAASSVKPPAKTASRRSSALLVARAARSSSRPTARSVCWRGGDGRGRRPSAAGSGRRAASRICSGREHAHARRGELDRERDAVEPLADLATAARVLVGQREARTGLRGAVDEELDRLERRRASPRRRRSPRRAATASAPRHAASPRTPSGSRLVASTRQRSGTRRAARPRRAAAPATRCSQLSSTSSVPSPPQSLGERRRASGRSAAPRARRARRRPRPGRRPGRRPVEVDEPDAVGVLVERSAAASSASRVLPHPPAPVSVTQPGARRAACRGLQAPVRGRRRSSAAAAGCSGRGRACAGAGSRPEGRPRRAGRCARAGRGRVSRCRPRSSTVLSSGSRSRTSS